MRITQVDPDIVTIDDLTINFNELTCSKGLLEKVYNLREKQSIAVTRNSTVLEQSKNKYHILDNAYNRLLTLPVDFPVEELPEKVTIFCNLGDDINPLYVEFDIDREKVFTALSRNPNFSITDCKVYEKVTKYLETIKS
jgi:hypothetical protein